MFLCAEVVPIINGRVCVQQLLRRRSVIFLHNSSRFHILSFVKTLPQHLILYTYLSLMFPIRRYLELSILWTTMLQVTVLFFRFSIVVLLKILAFSIQLYLTSSFSNLIPCMTTEFCWSNDSGKRVHEHFRKDSNIHFLEMQGRCIIFLPNSKKDEKWFF